MRASDNWSGNLFYYVDLEDRVSQGYALRVNRRIANDAPAAMSNAFEAAYAPLGRPARLLRSLLLQALCTIRSERKLVERLRFDLLLRWFVGLGIYDRVLDASGFARNRNRFLTMLRCWRNPACGGACRRIASADDDTQPGPVLQDVS